MTTTNYTINTFPPGKEELIERLLEEKKISFKEALILLEHQPKVQVQQVTPAQPWDWSNPPFTFTDNSKWGTVPTITSNLYAVK